MNWEETMAEMQKASLLNDCRDVVEVQNGSEFQIRKLMEVYPQYLWKYSEGSTIPGYMMKIAEQLEEEFYGINKVPLIPKVACAACIQNKWYRGKLENVPNIGGWIYVYLVDVGMSRQVTKNDIRYLDSKFGHYPPMVVRARIRGEGELKSVVILLPFSSYHRWCSAKTLTVTHRAAGRK
ncbi:hypothetical protein GCK72_013980 [Caenorhabditis remanei]|uniref:Tudor domain-containing protein n=1 Tax=Caenorhabditis remanei TaxID=31234 RepID=A0A6A5GS88_CAERE|nr:hypothetical protein GCK72_013980 [Caenorhabditis remanei]KAF1757524.1 hypothetical protein GCK72_013980 [Caenorhabditis remanei]